MKQPVSNRNNSWTSSYSTPSGSHTHLRSYTHIHVCQGQICTLHLKARKSKAVCIHGPLFGGWELVSFLWPTTTTVQPWSPGDSLTPLSASITQRHCDEHKSCLRISQEKKVPLFIPNLSSHFLLAELKKKITSAWRQRRSGKRTGLCTKRLQNQQRLLSPTRWTENMCSCYE